MIWRIGIVLCFFPALASAAVLTIVPADTLTQGDVFQIRIDGLLKGEHVQKIDFDGNITPSYVVGTSVRAVRGLPLSAKTGERTLLVTLNTGEVLQKVVHVLPKEKPVYSMPEIPQSLGGNTVKAETTLVSTLAEENKKLVNLFSQKKALWFVPFVPPVALPVVTDVFGYTREGSAVTVTHKGTDYRATIGTPVYSMNRGVVRLAKTFRNYGKTVVVDHGLGVMTFYMHLSRIRVAEGQLVQRKQLLGMSGDTGYVSAPHLHLTVRVNGASVDPESFLRVMGE